MKNSINQTVIYQIYPRSFMDTDGDGIGDLRGIIEKLTYIKELGIDMIWLTPIFVSPGNDNGYDIEDYYSVNPLFGDDKTLDELISKAKEMNIKIMFDMVFNHTSTHHKWFQKALDGDKKYQEYYFFKDIPTNWKSKFGGNAWEYVEHLKLYYLHLFDKTQADLNWENENVFNELVKVVNYWLDKGICGLRFDVINLISKPDSFKDDDTGDGRKYYTDGKKVHQHINKLNLSSFGKYKDILTVGELSSTSVEEAVKYASLSRNELSTVFGFHHLKVDYKNQNKWELQEFDFKKLKTILIDWQTNMQKEDASMALFWSNHDQPRIASRVNVEDKYFKVNAKMLANLMYMMRGMVYIYQGEEIGLPNANFNNIDQFKDIESKNIYKELLESKSNDEIINILNQRSRDNGRTPMLWDNSNNYGFTTGTPWLEFTNSIHKKTAQENLTDSDSIYYWYKKIITIRHNHRIVSEGSISFIDVDDDNLFNYIRTYEDESWIVINNVTSKEICYNLDTKYQNVILNNYENVSLDSKIVLRPYECLVLTANNREENS